MDLVNGVNDPAGAQADLLRVATLGLNMTQAPDLAANIDSGRIKRLTMLVAELFTEANVPEFNVLANLMRERGQVVKSNRNHCKLLLWHFADGRKFSAHGSLNLRRCNSFEQIAINQDAALHDFFAEYIDDVATVGETQRREGAEARKKGDTPC